MMDGPIHKGIFPYVLLLPPTPNFPVMIYPAQVVWLLYSVSYSLPHPSSTLQMSPKYSNFMWLLRSKYATFWVINLSINFEVTPVKHTCLRARP